MNTIRVGIGFDAHRLVPGRPLILGGAKIPFERGLQGWSDADVATHAIIDAVLGATSLGSIGSHFPSGDPAYKDISSMLLLNRTGNLLREQGWHIINIDVTIIAERPLIHPYVDQMKRNLSQALSVETNRLGIKATTTEGMGFTGKGEGIAACSVALVEKHDQNI